MLNFKLQEITEKYLRYQNQDNVLHTRQKMIHRGQGHPYIIVAHLINFTTEEQIEKGELPAN